MASVEGTECGADQGAAAASPCKGGTRCAGQDPAVTSRPSAVSIWDSSFEKSTGFGW
jgi:hypothetical protein